MSSSVLTPVPNHSLFIKRIPFETRSDDLRALFSRYGRVKDVYIPRDYYSKRIRGFAYVEYPFH
ncbi:RNA recognition motif containing protein 2 [Sarcoptes scabiei]|uniref:RNA recognition motif containing protein 2 n=1 Tax=Sarcoptes scabiei TaxID=52283 RepID=A0A132AJB7_SARSC|nr:RNA recognition motif containing protein 2 [Sarcoptes scabiei]